MDKRSRGHRSATWYHVLDLRAGARRCEALAEVVGFNIRGYWLERFSAMQSRGYRSATWYTVHVPRCTMDHVPMYHVLSLRAGARSCEALAEVEGSTYAVTG